MRGHQRYIEQKEEKVRIIFTILTFCTQFQQGTRSEVKVPEDEKRPAYDLGAGLTEKITVDDLSPDDVIIA